MSGQELKELDAWIAIHMFDWIRVAIDGKCLQEPNGNQWSEAPSYTADPAAAMEVLKRCAGCGFNIEIFKTADGNWWVATTDRFVYSSSESLELSICLFAKKLFTK